MKLTVITINYNNLSGLKKTLKSVFEQTFQDFEYIMIDGGSTDGSKELIESYSDKFDYWISERDGGIYNAMNKGLKKATGDYVIHMNSGDTFFKKDTLELAIPQLESGEDFIYGDAFFFNRINNEPDSLWLYPKKLSFDFFKIGTLNHQALFTKRKLHDVHGLYSEKYRIISDWLFILEALVYGNATYKHINMTLCNYDQAGFSAVNWGKAVKEREDVLRNRFSFFTELYNQNEYGSVLKKKIPRDLKQLVKKMIKAVTPYGLLRFRQMMLEQKAK